MATAKGSNPGNKEKYTTHVEPRLETIRAWKRMGLTNEVIAENLGIAVGTMCKYQNEHKELNEALKTGKSDADAIVENMLFKRVSGYTETVNGKDVYIPSDMTAIIFYLKNRKSADWNDKTQHEHSGEINNVVASCSDDELNKRLGAIESAIKDKATE